MKSRILIIDDEESIRFAFKTHLSRAGNEVLTAKDYSSAFDIISRDHIDVIIVDIILGGNTGIDILHEVKNLRMNCPVIMITGEPNIDTAGDALRLGAFDYLPKPVKKDTLLNVINHAVTHKAILDEKDRIEAEKERFRSNMEAMFRSLKDAIITVTPEMLVTETNEAARSICGFQHGEIIGKQFTEVPGQCRGACHKVLTEVLKTKSTIREYRIECGHQERPRQIVLLTSSPLTDKEDRFIGAVLVVRDITRLTDLERELRQRHRFHRIIGKSERMQEIYKLIEDLASAETTVLITGETGTGKELVARALHYSGTRAAGPLIKINCSALAENLLESELFGHVKGAFTGAVKNKMGRFQSADGGAIFLDEIGDISPRIQLKLLRFFEEREFERVGDSNPIKVDVRVITATNRDLKRKVALGEFRKDLYYRLKVVEITLPSLWERREDIPLLVEHFRSLFDKRFNKNIDGISDKVLSTFMHYPWPGNIRELEHAIEHAFVLCHSRTIRVDHLPSEIREHSKVKSHRIERMSANEPQEILHALNKTGWNKAKAARVLGISRQTIYRKIHEHNINAPSE